MTETTHLYVFSVQPWPAALPAGWQDWTVGADIPGIRRYLYLRGLAGTPLGRDAKEYLPGDPPVAPPATEAELRAAQAYADSLEPTPALRGDTRLRDMLLADARGKLHGLARYAPWQTTADQASGEYTDATLAIASPFTCAVVRAAVPAGYQAWTGVGGMMEAMPGRWETYESAREAAVVQILAARRKLATGLLRGWAEETPFFSGTLRTWPAALPIVIRRGPVSGACSWDLPVVHRWQDGHYAPVDLYLGRDEESRREIAERDRAGKARAEAALRMALDRARELDPRLVAPHGRGLRYGPWALRGGGTVELLGPARITADGRSCLQALVRLESDRPHGSTWLACEFLAVGQEVAQ